MSWRDAARLYVCDILMRAGALQFGTFKLTSGRISPYYIDMRLLPSFPAAFKKVCGIYVDVIKEDIGPAAFERIAGIPTAGLPYASVIAYRLGKPFLYTRREARAHGRERMVEGVLSPGDRVLIVDDIVTTGKSIIQAAKILRSEGAKVEDVIVLIDREEGARPALKAEGLQLHSLMGIRDAAEILHGRGVVEDEQYTAIIKQIRRQQEAKG
ncbi:MAG: orotate phosphoribosyltransferase [Candidatus Bathyarchaeia archaeon]